jgi:hypothetical protein
MAGAVPFSHAAFLDVFGAYNTALWPVAAGLWLATAFTAWRWLRRQPLPSRAVFALLAVHWLWSGIVYHFRPINPAATIFGAGFVLQGAIFVWLAALSEGNSSGGAGLRRSLGAALVIYGLVYPLLGLAAGLEYPRLPLFAVPCPTTLVTAGWLVASTGVPRAVNLVPLIWAGIGSSAAFALGIRADLALVAAGLALAFNVLAPRRR